MRLSEGRFLNFLIDFSESLARPWAMDGRFWSLLLVASGNPQFTCYLCDVVFCLQKHKISVFMGSGHQKCIIVYWYFEGNKSCFVSQWAMVRIWQLRNSNSQLWTQTNSHKSEAGTQLIIWKSSWIKKLRNKLRLSRAPKKLRNLRLWREAGIS